jgi:drug/metabolite transporter (DMT)-like permease
VFFSGVVALIAAGARHQDHKLRTRRGPPYADYLAVTSTIPFVAIVAGRQTFAWRELPAAPLAIALGLALAARHWHDSLFADGGWWVIAVVLGGALLAGGNAWRRSRRAGARVADGGALPLVCARSGPEVNHETGSGLPDHYNRA